MVHTLNLDGMDYVGPVVDLSEKFRATDIGRAANLGFFVVAADNAPEWLVEQLIANTRQEHVMDHEGHEDYGDADDEGNLIPDEHGDVHPGRFYDKDAYEAWSKKGRLMVPILNLARASIINGKPDLANIQWFGDRTNEHAPGRDVTMGIRTYEGYNGTSMGKPFMKGAHKVAAPAFEDRGIWLDLVEGNHPAENLYRGVGYEEIVRVPDTEVAGRTRIVMAHDTIFASGNPVEQVA